jgi:hypothetical protein
MTTDINLTSTTTTERSGQERSARPGWRRPLLLGAAAAAGVVCLVAIRAGSGADTPTPAPVVPAEPVVHVEPAASVEPDPCIVHKPC